jgi:inosine-uridine nucleoside N-ribohydrolase
LPAARTSSYKVATMRRIVLDTDIGTDVDDALALALALASPEIELVAVTTVSGDTAVRARIAARLLALAGRADVPVHAGCTEPLGGTAGFAWFGHEGDGILDGSRDAIAPEPAVDALSRLFRQADDLELVTVGPLTNVAVALERDPALAGRIVRLTAMGGWLRGVTIGKKPLPPAVDYNLCSDPVASRRVLSAGIPTRLVPADVTVRVWLTDADVGALERSASALHAALARAVRVWSPLQRNLFAGLGAPLPAENAAFLHDPLALACAHDESFCSIEELVIEPVTVDGVFRTRVCAPGASAGFRMRCATAVHATRFTDHVRRRLGIGGSEIG